MLEQLTPREFEEYCQALFMQYFRCPVDLTPATGDEGRDLLVHHPQGLQVVECKHYPAGTVGRPVVQKLHSAILTAAATKGVIVTSGKFSAEAEHYCAKLHDVAIELIDAAKLSYVISITWPKGSAGAELANAIRTTTDRDFPQLFAKSVFSVPRYHGSSGTTVPVKVERTTKYSPYFLANYHAEGAEGRARGTFEADWSGEVWVRADGRGAGIGMPPPARDHDPRSSSLATALRETGGKVEPPHLQPHQALGEMRDFLSRRLVARRSYIGRNNRFYQVAIHPSANRIRLSSLLLCYCPLQRFFLRIGNVGYEGSVVEQANAFRVECRELSMCVVCGGGTSARTQILCAFCFRPAHRWAILSPDSYQCRQCGTWVCRHHIGRIGTKYLCKRCQPDATALWRRWLWYFLVGVLCSMLAVIIALAVPGTRLIWAPAIFLSGWSPLLGLLLHPVVFRRPRALLYPKPLPDS